MVGFFIIFVFIVYEGFNKKDIIRANQMGL